MVTFPEGSIGVFAGNFLVRGRSAASDRKLTQSSIRNETQITAAMITPLLSHDDISRRAAELWKAHGQPADRDVEFWLQAERELSSFGQNGVRSEAATAEPAPFAERVREETAVESAIEYQMSPPGSQEDAIKAAVQNQSPGPSRQVDRSARPGSSKPPVKTKGQSSR